MRKPQLFVIHHAGGNSYSFQFLAPFLPDFETISPELPGRGKRIEEPLLKDFDQAAQDIYQQITNKMAGDHFILYGHSMGAYLALRVANMLEKEGKHPVCLLVSGNAGPGVRENKNRYLMAHDDFMEELRNLGGLPEEFIQDKDLVAFFEPILRADFEVVEKKDIASEPAVNTPIYAMMGSEEHNPEKISNWANFTRSEFNCEILKGDHFFIRRHPQRIAAIIKYWYEKSIKVPYN